MKIQKLKIRKIGSQNNFVNVCYIILNQLIRVFRTRRFAHQRRRFALQIQPNICMKFYRTGKIN